MISGFDQNSKIFFTIGEDWEKRYYIEKFNEVGKDVVNIELKEFE